jgi:hypothetical protein
MKVLSLVDRTTGRARSFVVLDLTSKTIGTIANGVDDKARAVLALQGVVGKRLTYRRADGGAPFPA